MTNESPTRSQRQRDAVEMDLRSNLHVEKFKPYFTFYELILPGSICGRTKYDHIPDVVTFRGCIACAAGYNVADSDACLGAR
eukprot:5286139-Amphidinium_carterae.1